MTETLMEIPQGMTDITISRDPITVLNEARKAAMALDDVLKNKSNPVRFNGHQYLEFEDWQTLGRFYGITAKIVSSEYVEYGETKGFTAKAVALRVSTGGEEISAAESMCLDDEKNWRIKPLFQLKSMAQTRACAKCLRNVLAWVVVLAGYKPTPAEELNGTETFSSASSAPKRKAPQRKTKAAPAPAAAKIISDAQRKRAYAIARSSGYTDEEFKNVIENFGFSSSKEITKDKYDEIVEFFKSGGEPTYEEAEEAV